MTISSALRSDIYRRIKNSGIPIKWPVKNDRLIAAYGEMNRAKLEAKQEANQRKLEALRRVADEKRLESLNELKPTEMRLGDFNRVFERIPAPSTHSAVIDFLDEHGDITRAVNLQQHNYGVHGLFFDEENQFSSDADVSLYANLPTKVRVHFVSNNSNSRIEEKHFFPWLMLRKLPLSDYQVYTRDDRRNNDPCFLVALEKAGCSSDDVKSIRSSMVQTGATIRSIREAAENNQLHISVKQYIDADHAKTTHYGDKALPEIKLGCIAKHLFALRKTKITRTCLDHPEISKSEDCPFWPSFTLHHGVPKKSTKCLDSYQVIAHLFNNRDNMLEPITQSSLPKLINNQFQPSDHLSETDFVDRYFKSLDVGKRRGHHPFIDEDGNELPYSVVYFDFETFPLDGKEIEYAVAWKIDDDETQVAYGLNCARVFLDSLPHGNNLLLAHNAGFDRCLLVKHLTAFPSRSNVIDAGTRLKQLNGYYFTRHIIIKDTMSFLNYRLADLPRMFPGSCDGMTLEKECFPHELIDMSNYRTMWPLSYLDSFEHKDMLIENASRIGAIRPHRGPGTSGSSRDEQFDARAYAMHYCKRDVDVLYNCFTQFRALMKNRFQQDVYRHISIPGIAYDVQNNAGCFNDCYALSGPVLSFVRQAIVGGRVMTRDNEKHHTTHPLVDFDAVSLYPSAMHSLPGYVVGKPKLFRDSIPSDATYFIVRIRITAVHQQRHFPLLSIRREMSREYTNDLVGQTMIVGKVSLEDAVEFQGIEYEVVEGVYWDEGFNKTICTVIKDMFQERLRLKAEHNPLQECMKQLLNSSYGKVIQKPIIKQKTLVAGRDKIDQRWSQKISRVISRTKISANIELFEEHKQLAEHFSPAHLGVQVLDHSKHLMNQVMCLAEDIGATIWYQDTDSMHLDRAALPDLTSTFQKKYNRELVGKDLGQFHSDFSLDGSEGEVFAAESIFLSKKSYLDHLACDGNQATGFHIRMKGIPSKLLSDDPMETYSKLLAGESLSVDLARVCPIKIDSKSMTISRRTEFPRTICFA